MSNLNDTLLGKIDTCPHCNTKLKATPSRKKKCEFCGEFIYVRTRPQDRKKVLLTEKDAEQIEIQWQQQYQQSADEKLLQDPEFFNARNELSKSFGKEASINDTKWKVYNQRDLEYIQNDKWGSYRNNKFDEVRLLLSEKKNYKQALTLLFEICILEINGTNDYPEGYSNAEIKKLKVKKFDLTMGRFAPGIISLLQETIENAGYNSIVETEDLFYISTKNIIELNPTIPIKAEDAWIELLKFVGKRNQLKSIDPKDTQKIIDEINQRIERRAFAEASELIYKLSKNNYDSKIISKSDFNLIKINLEKWLYSANFNISRASQSLFWSLVKKDYNGIKELSHEYINYILQNPDDNLSWTTISQFYVIDKHFTISLIPKLIKILTDYPQWNIRRICSHNIADIGSKDINLVKEAIPVMINYIENPYEVTKSNPIKIKFNDQEIEVPFDFSPEKLMNVDQKQWLRDAYIDSIGLIIKGNKDAMMKYKPIFEKIAKKDKYESAMKKAQQVLNLF